MRELGFLGFRMFVLLWGLEAYSLYLVFGKVLIGFCVDVRRSGG